MSEESTSIVSSHPAFPNPTLTEVVCELRFDHPPARPWSPAAIREFHKRISANYPAVERSVEVQVGGTPVPTEVRQTRERGTYRSDDDARQLKLADGTFSIHVVGQGKYEGWDWFRAYAEESWGELKDELGLTAVKRLGLRYINRVDRSSHVETPGRWLVQTDYVPGAILLSQGRFLSRLECRNDTDNATVVTIGINQESPEDIGGLIFDIDRIREAPVGEEIADIFTVASEIHDDVWQVFSEALTPEYLGLLGEPTAGAK